MGFDIEGVGVALRVWGSTESLELRGWQGARIVPTLELLLPKGSGVRETTSHKCAAVLYLRLIDLVYHSTLGLRVIKKKGRPGESPRRTMSGQFHTG